jgi:flagellar hook-associated protein 3 FlgL
MDLNIKSSTNQYLNDLSNIQRQMAKAQTEVSSGLRVQQASDDPAAIETIFQTQTAVAMNQQTQSNLGSAQTEISAADTALQSSISVVQTVLTVAAQAASSNMSAQDRLNLVDQVSALQQTLVSLSQTMVNGRYIFSGDQNTLPSYQVDPTQPEGVQQLLVTSATRTIADANGAPIAIARTAQQIFDPQAGGAPAQGNTFAAVNLLLTALQSNTPAGITQATDDLKAAGDYLNNQLSFYGAAESRVSDALSLSQKFQIQEKTNLGQVQNADLASVALQLTQTATEQQAALAVAAKLQQMPTLLSLLG